MITNNKLMVFSVALLSGQASSWAQDNPSERSNPILEEVVVTARFREEGIQDIGGSVGALSGDAMERDGVDDFGDVANRIVGLGLIDRGPNQNDLSVRGAAAAVPPTLIDILPGATPVVSQFFNDIPIASPDGSQRDFNMFDLNRIEVLRGPQPTLFGEGSVGGTVRYFTNEPTLDGNVPVSGRLQANVSSTQDGGTNYSLQGVVDATLVPDVLGIRATAFLKDNDGFIDNPVMGTEDANTVESQGGSITVLYRPTDRLDMKFFAKVEDDDNGEAWFVDPPDSQRFISAPTGAKPEDLTLSRFIPGGSGFSIDEATVLGGTIEYAADSFTITSITGYYERDRDFGSWNPTLNLLSSQALLVPNTPVVNPTTRLDRIVSEEQFTQEFRFFTTFDGPLNFTGGLYYKDGESSTRGETTDVAGLELITFPSTPFPFIGSTSRETEQISGFLEATWDVTDRLSVTGGARYVSEDVIGEVLENRSVFFIPPILPNALVFLNTPELGTIIPTIPPLDTRQTFELREWLPRFSAEYDLSDDVLLYANWARGVRNGGVNQTGAIAFNIFIGALDPTNAADFLTYGEDQNESIEFGVKTTLADGDLTLNGALFQTDFTDVQTGFAPTGGFNLIGNGPDQKTRGIEIEGTWRIMDTLSATFGYTHMDAEFQSFADVNGNGIEDPEDILKGNSPVGVPETQFNLSLDYYRPLNNGLAITAGGSVLYQGERESRPNNAPLSQLESLTLVNLRLGIQADNWNVSAFVKNAANTLEFVNLAVEQAFVNQPRTMGLIVGYSF